MPSLIQGGASNKITQQKIQIVKSISQQELADLRKLNEAHKASKINKFGYANKGGFRHVASIPMDVYRKMVEVDPSIDESKSQFNKTLDMFPIFKSADKI